jgi:hypothetical protein
MVKLYEVLHRITSASVIVARTLDAWVMMKVVKHRRNNV